MDPIGYTLVVNIAVQYPGGMVANRNVVSQNMLDTLVAIPKILFITIGLVCEVELEYAKLLIAWMLAFAVLETAIALITKFLVS